MKEIEKMAEEFLNRVEKESYSDYEPFFDCMIFDCPRNECIMLMAQFAKEYNDYWFKMISKMLHEIK